MRNLSANALNKLKNRFGNEAIIIIDVAWNENVVQYAERTVEGIKGRILEVTALDNIITVSRGDDSQEISVKLDDTDGTIKNIMDAHDIHKRDVWVYQWFEGLDLEDRFLLFHGKISSPIAWNEGDRTISFSIISQIEDKEVGFSPEEGQFPYIPKDLIGKAWPSVFGKPLDVPAVRISTAVKGTLLCGVGILSGQNLQLQEPLGGGTDGNGTPPDTTESNWQISYLSSLAYIFRDASGIGGHGYAGSAIKYVGNQDYMSRAQGYEEQAQQLREQVADAWGQYDRSQRCAVCRRTETVQQAEQESMGAGCNPVTILGGEDFPRGNITLKIGDSAYIAGYFKDESDEFVIVNRWHVNNDEKVQADKANDEKYCPDCEPQGSGGKHILWETDVPYGYGNKHDDLSIYKKEGYIMGSDPSIAVTKTPSRARDSRMKSFWADAGTSVKLATDPPFTHVISIVPGTILQVKAFKNFHGDRTLVSVPTELWAAETKQYGSITAEQVIVEQLTAIEGQEWDSDDIYVTFESDVGPNIVDILTYLIQTYSDLEIDSTSFNDVKIKLEPFPANFAILDRKNLVEVLQDIAFQARCSLRLSNKKFYLKYLAEEPTIVDTITENDIEHNSIEIFLTSTEDLVTKYTVFWRLSYAQEEMDKIILRHNVKKYGVQEEEYEYYIYNQPDIVHKIATFWLIRKSNSWKHIRFNTFLHKLNLETFDSVLLNFQKSYVANSSVKAEIEQANFDSENQTVTIECWLPIKSGQMDQYIFAWPANASDDAEFPTAEEIEQGLAGGNGIGMGATGDLPVGDTSRIEDSAIFIGGNNVVYGGQTDQGDNHPSDGGFIAQSIGPFNIYATIVVQAAPDPNTKLNYADQIKELDLDANFGSSPEIILERTKIKSIRNPNQWNTLADILISQEDKPLAIKTAVLFCGQDEGGCKTSPLDFKYHSDEDVWSAGSAYLYDDEPPHLAGSQEGELLGECE